LDYILKPFKLSVIVPVLARALAVRRLRVENAELERRVREHTAELAAANQELEAFSYSVSHDLRAPLRHIDGFAGLLAKHLDPRLDETGRRYLTTISGAAKQMGVLIDDLLAFSRIGRAELRRTRVDLAGLVREVLRILEPETAGRDIAWAIGELPEVQGDPQLLRLVLQNLIGNALKYTRTRPEARIEIGARREGTETVCSIRDNGVGFDMRYVERLFGVFQRLHTSAEFEGTGIGLATVRRIVHRHGGRVWAEGEVDRGACFYVALPNGGVLAAEPRG
ncbi:MAG: sensor histidine kinase, partial [Thermoleophilaceae bacterium]